MRPAVSRQIRAPGWVLSGGGPDATVDLDFANERYWGGNNAALTCSRSTSGYVDDANGNWSFVDVNRPRIGRGKGLLVEEARTNLLVGSWSIAVSNYLNVTGGSGNFIDGETCTFTGGGSAIYLSAQSTSAIAGVQLVTAGLSGTMTGGTSGATRTVSSAGPFAWNNTGMTAVVANSTDVTDPLGTKTATKLTTSNGSVKGCYEGAITVSASTSYTFSFYIQLGTLSNSDFAYAIYNETASSFIASGITATITPGPNGWYRVVNTFTTAVGQTALRVYVYRNNPATGGTFYIWGAQVEAGTFATSPIPTLSTTLQRNADVVTLTNPPPFGGVCTLFGKGTLVSPGNHPTNASLFGIDDLTFANDISLWSPAGGSTAGFQLRVANVATNGNTAFVPTQGVSFKLAGSFTAGRQAVTANGGTIATAAAAALPTNLPNCVIGGISGTAQSFNGYVERVALWQANALPDTALQAITT